MKRKWEQTTLCSYWNGSNKRCKQPHREDLPPEIWSRILSLLSTHLKTEILKISYKSHGLMNSGNPLFREYYLQITESDEYPRFEKTPSKSHQILKRLFLYRDSRWLLSLRTVCRSFDSFLIREVDLFLTKNLEVRKDLGRWISDMKEEVTQYFKHRYTKNTFLCKYVSTHYPWESVPRDHHFFSWNEVLVIEDKVYCHFCIKKIKREGKEQLKKMRQTNKMWKKYDDLMRRKEAERRG